MKVQSAPKTIFFLNPQKQKASLSRFTLPIKLDDFGQRLIRYLSMNTLKGDFWNVQ
jgi:hypothetical protein